MSIVTRHAPTPTTVALLALLAGACSREEPTVIQRGPMVLPTAASLTLRAGDTASIALDGAPSVRGTVRWQTTDASVVQVDTSSAIDARVGVRAIGPGQAALLADATTTDGQRILASIPVTVTTAARPATTW